MKIRIVAVNLFAYIEPMFSETPDICVLLGYEPCITVSQGARMWPNTLLGEAFLNIEQWKLDYLNRKMQGNCMCLTMRESPSLHCQHSTTEETASLVQGSLYGATVCSQNTSKLPNIYKHFFPQIYTA